MEGITKEDILSGKHAEKLFFRKEHIDQKSTTIKWIFIVLFLLIGFWTYSFISKTFFPPFEKFNPKTGEGIIEEKIPPQSAFMGNMFFKLSSNIKIMGTLAGNGSFCDRTSKAIKDTFTITGLRINGELLFLNLTTNSPFIKSTIDTFKSRDYITKNLGQKIIIWGKGIVSFDGERRYIFVEAIQIGDDYYSDKTGKVNVAGQTL